MRQEAWRDGRGRAWRISVPETRLERARGLLGRVTPAPNEGLFLARCRSAHTFGMRSTIEAVLLDRELSVLLVARMRPGRLLLPRRGARHILEVAAGSGLRPGDRFEGPLRRSTLRPSCP